MKIFSSKHIFDKLCNRHYREHLFIFAIKRGENYEKKVRKIKEKAGKVYAFYFSIN